MFIQTEDTPNPATMKFIVGQPVVDVPLDIPSASQAHVSPLAQSLFNIEGVRGVFFGKDFVSVTRDETVDWPILRPSILTTIMDHFLEGKPVLIGVAEPKRQPQTENEADSDVVAKINELLDQRIRPAVAQDGGDVAFERYDNGVVYLRLKGACAGCPSATATLKFGIEQMLRHFIPEVQEVRRAE